MELWSILAYLLRFVFPLKEEFVILFRAFIRILMRDAQIRLNYAFLTHNFFRLNFFLQELVKHMKFSPDGVPNLKLIIFIKVRVDLASLLLDSV